MISRTTAGAFVALVFVLASCAPSSAVMVVSRNEEVSIGKQVEKDVIKQYGGVYNDPAMNARVQRVGRQCAAVSTRTDVTYTYKVLNSDVINAFAAPGGPVLITKKLVQVLNTDDQLAFVLAHETGHIAAQHGRKAINRAVLAQGIASLLLRKAGESAKIGVGIMYTLYDRGYSREQEYEADSYGALFMTRAKFNAEGGVKALAKLGMRREKGVNKYLSTHPDVPDRISRIARAYGITPEREQALIKEAQTEK